MRLMLTILFISIFLVGKGQSISNFELLDVISGTQFKLSDLQNKKAVVVIFFSNKCAYAIHYVDRINHLQQKFDGRGVEFVLINSNTEDFTPEESAEKMKKTAATYQLTLPYLSDKEQVVQDLLGAKRTPEVFMLKPEANGFRLVYHGAIDDNPQIETDVYHHYLNDAVLSLLSGNPIKTNNNRPVGCLIK